MGVLSSLILSLIPEFGFCLSTFSIMYCRWRVMTMLFYKNMFLCVCDDMRTLCCTLSWLSFSRSESMTAVVPMTVRSRRCSERLSDRTLFTPCQYTHKHQRALQSSQCHTIQDIIWPWTSEEPANMNTKFYLREAVQKPRTDKER